ncbi:MAG TPA: ABC transporter permease [Verrucomicrobiae bacterium]|jgi:lipoprotein-releasing system permease protein|nr:ABC transporter permease [Verrucomicrobiae bacterium]
MSKLPFELLLAFRYLRPRRSFVSIITVISIIGVALGVAVLIIVISVMSGFAHDLRQQILGFNAPVEIRGVEGRPIAGWEDLSRVVSSNKNVTGVAPYVLGPVLLETQATNGSGQFFATPMMRGVDVSAEGSVSVLPQKILPGGSFDLSGQTIIVGSVFAEQYALNVGDHVSIFSPSEIKKMADQLQHGNTNTEAFLPDDYTISGIFNVGYYPFDSQFIGASLENAQDLYDLEDSVHGLSVKISDPFQAAEVKQQLADKLGPNFEIVTWEEQNSALLGAVAVEKSMMYYIMFFIVVVASFGITCTLITFVMMKTREIGIMKAIGATNYQVMLVFVLQSVVISIFGVASGLSLGLLALYFRNPFLNLVNRLTGWELFPSSIYGFSQLPAIIAPMDIIIICGGSFIICLLAAILPARHASKMNTVEALRYE